MIRFFILLGLIFIAIVAGFVVLGSYIDQIRTKQAMRKALKKSNQTGKQIGPIDDLIMLYMQMVAKYGPNSIEAKAFRFGTDSPLIRELHGDNKAMQEFERQAKIIDETYNSIKNIN